LHSYLGVNPFPYNQFETPIFFNLNPILFHLLLVSKVEKKTSNLCKIQIECYNFVSCPCSSRYFCHVLLASGAIDELLNLLEIWCNLDGN
jgi:hypothetical protein